MKQLLGLFEVGYSCKGGDSSSDIMERLSGLERYFHGKSAW
jgi:hypothetical protein